MPSVSIQDIKVEVMSFSLRVSLAMASLLVLVVAGAAFLLGQATAEPRAATTGISLEHIKEIRPALLEQRARLNESRQQLAANQAAIARRLGQMQAEILRLNAAGQKLTQLADLSEEEFDFASAPAVGGPAQPGDELLAPTNDALDQLESELALKERQLDVLEHLLLVSQLHSERYPSGWPVQKGWISSVFGRRMDPFTGRTVKHSGVDFAARYGSDVVAVAGGVVSFAGVRSGYGNVVEINHGNGYVTRYGHNSKNLVRSGDRVVKAQPIAMVGQSGRATGPHVHFEVLVDGQRIDPEQYIARR